MVSGKWTTAICATGLSALFVGASGCVDVPHRRHPDGAADVATRDDVQQTDRPALDASALDVRSADTAEPDAMDVGVFDAAVLDSVEHDVDYREVSVGEAGDAALGDACGGDAQACDGRCVDLMTDPQNCGMCGLRCTTTNHRGPSCQRGVCTSMGCEAGYGDCDGNSINGCETAINTRLNCGMCGRRGVSESCNGVDDNCNGVTDENCPHSVLVVPRPPASATNWYPRNYAYVASGTETRAEADVLCPGGYVLRGLLVSPSRSRPSLIGVVRVRCAQILVSSAPPYTLTLGADEDGDGRPLPVDGWERWTAAGVGSVCPSGQVVIGVDMRCQNSASSPISEGITQLRVRCGELTLNTGTGAVSVQLPDPASIAEFTSLIPPATSYFSVIGGYCFGSALTGMRLDAVSPEATVLRVAEFCADISITIR